MHGSTKVVQVGCTIELRLSRKIIVNSRCQAAIVFLTNWIKSGTLASVADRLQTPRATWRGKRPRVAAGLSAQATTRLGAPSTRQPPSTRHAIAVAAARRTTVLVVVNRLSRPIVVLDGLPGLYGLKYDSATACGTPLYLYSYKLVSSAIGSIWHVCGLVNLVFNLENEL